MSFHLATTMYEHYYQREPVNFLIMFIYLPTTTYACYWPSAAVYIFSLCASSQPQSCMNALLWWFGLFFYCASSWPRPCMNVTVQEVYTIFLLCVSNQPRPRMNIIIKENQLIFLLCSSIYLRPRMHVIGQVLQSMFFHYVLPASHNHV